MAQNLNFCNLLYTMESVLCTAITTCNLSDHVVQYPQNSWTEAEPLLGKAL